MDVALGEGTLNLYDNDQNTRIFTEDVYTVPQYIGPLGSVKRSIANQGSVILGSVDSCVISSDAIIKEGAECTRCVIMAGALIGHNAKVNNAIIAPGVVIEDDAEINLDSEKIVLISKEAKNNE